MAVLFLHHDLHIVDWGAKLILLALALGVRSRAHLYQPKDE